MRGKVRSEVITPGSSDKRFYVKCLAFTHLRNTETTEHILSICKTLHLGYQLTESRHKLLNILCLKVQSSKKEFKKILKSARVTGLLELGARLLY